MTHLIGLAGLMGSGKDAVADILVDMGGYVKYGFGYALRYEIADILKTRECPDDYPDNLRDIAELYYGKPEKLWQKPTPPLMRILLQEHGSEYRRAQDPDYWVRQVMEAIFLLPKVVLTDVRFENEYRMVKEDGGEIWLVQRANRPGASNEGHVSEQFVKTLGPHNVDRVIANDGSLEDLYRKVEEALWCSPVAA